MGQYLLYVVAPILVGVAAQRHVQATFTHYAAIANRAGLTGREVAGRILAANGLDGEIHVMSASGALTDHYNPRERTVHLSEPVFQGSGVSAAAVAAHEVGHALQHAAAWGPFRIRSTLWPLASFASNAWLVLLLVGAMLGTFGLVAAALALFAAVVLFQLVTLPVELDASRRAHQQLTDLGLLDDPDEAVGARRVLRAAAFTYVVAALASALLLLYYAGVLRRG